MSLRFRICLAAWVATIIGSAWCGSVNADVFAVSEDWEMEISPAFRVYAPETVVVTDAAESNESESVMIQPATATAQSAGDAYRRIYDSIPFNRAEYNFNPTYRHDSAMEIMTGNARHQTVVTHRNEPATTQRTFIWRGGFQSQDPGFRNGTYPLRRFYWGY